MFWQRLEAIRVAIAEQVREAVAALVVEPPLIGAKALAWLRSFLLTCWRTLVWAFRGVFVPQVSAPLDVLKHYLVVLFMAMAVLTLFWTAQQNS